MHSHSPFACTEDDNIKKTKNIIEIIEKDTSDILNPKLLFSDPLNNWIDLHYNSIVVDTHNDFLWQMYKRNAEFGKRDPGRHTSLVKLMEGGVSVQIFAIWLPADNPSPKNFVLQQINTLKTQQQIFSNYFEIAYSFNDIERIYNSKRLCGMFGIEGGTPIEDDLNNINLFFNSGVRYIGLTWDNSNDIATSANDEEKKNKTKGLSDFGKSVIKRMNEVGMLIDVSHLGEKSFFDVMNITTSPVIASHSCCRAINNSYRNLTDLQIKEIAKSGGVIMINFNKGYLSTNTGGTNAYEKYRNELDKIYDESKSMNEFNEKRDEFLSDKIPTNEVTIENIILHIEHIKNLVGIDYVGLGSDFDGGIAPPYDMYDATCFPLLTKNLAKKGYSELEIRKILGLNFLRVFKQVCG